MHTAQMSKRHMLSGGRYPVLRTIAILYLIVAAVTAIAGIAGFIWALARGPAIYGLGQAPVSWGGRISEGLGILATTFFACVAMLVVAEVIKLFIDVEHNTRTSAMALALRAQQLQPSATMAPLPAETVVPPGSTVATSNTTPNRIAVFFHSPDEESAEAALIRGH